MTYPPQQPGPYGQDPYGQQPQQPPQSPPYGQPSPPYGQQPSPPPYGGQPSPPYGQPPQPQQPPQFGGQTSYQGLGSYGGQPPEPPKKRNTGMIVAIVLIVLLVVGGGGVALFVLNKDDDKPNASTNTTDETSQSESPSEDETAASEDADEPTRDEDEDPTGSNGESGDASNSPEDVRQAYMDAYENKSFSAVVNNACDAYKEEYGTDTSELEQQLEPFEITATASGEPEVTGSTARADIDLELTQGGTSRPANIFIKIVEEDGEWRFCGEGEA